MNSNLEQFGNLPSGEVIHRVTLSNGGLTASFITFGAILQDLRKDGFDYPLVLGSNRLEPYFGALQHAGALVGRFANRLTAGRFTIDGKCYQVPKNFRDRHSLHGGPEGTSIRVWRIDQLTAKSVIMKLDLPDGDMGFPGALEIRAYISLGDTGELVFDIKATTSRPTICSIAHHSYFNLSGDATINDHELEVKADAFLPIDKDLIPLGNTQSVQNHQYDFRQRKILSDIFIDHNFCLSDHRKDCRKVASLFSRKAGLGLEVMTNETGLQIYTGDGVNSGPSFGLDGRTYSPRAGIALETQCWPDAPNYPNFPSAILRENETYHHQAIYKFFTF